MTGSQRPDSGGDRVATLAKRPSVTGARATIYWRARDVIRSEPLLDSLRPRHVDPDRDDLLSQGLEKIHPVIRVW